MDDNLICGECQCASCCFRSRDVSNYYQQLYGVDNCPWPWCERCDLCTGEDLDCIKTGCNKYKYDDEY